MIKVIYINQKRIPVPVPIQSVGAALEWVGKTLLPDGHVVTRVALNDQVFVTEGDEADNQNRKLLEQDKLEILIDSPMELASATIEAIRNLTSVVRSGLKPLAVECWQAKPIDQPEELASVVSDQALILELTDHLQVLLNGHSINLASLGKIEKSLRDGTTSLQMAIQNSDWRAAARLLLNRLDPLFQEVTSEIESIQIRLLTRLNSNEYQIAKIQKQDTTKVG